MGSAREIMHEGAVCIDENDTLFDAALKMLELDVGSLPVCGSDDHLKGMITDRDIVVKCVALGGDVHTMTAAELAQGTIVWVDADADADEVLRLMEQHQIRRVPVLEAHRLVGMISEADIARCLPGDKIAEFVEGVYAAR